MRIATAIIILCTVLTVCAAPGFGQVEDVRSERPPGEGPTRVEVMFYIMDLMRVIDTEQAFEADVFVLASWNDPRQIRERVQVVPTDEVWVPKVLMFNKREVSSTLPEEVEIRPDGTVIYRQRLTGTFASALDLTRFPMDSQTFEIRLVVYGASPDEVLLVESTVFPASRSTTLSITDWRIGELETSTGTFSPTPAGPKLSTFSVSVKGKRLIGYYVVQMLIPLILIVGMSWVVFWIDPSVVPARMSISVTTVLTLIAYRFMIGSLVPKLPYLTSMDYLLLGATVLVAGSLVTVATGTYLVGQDRAAAAARLNRIARPVFPAGFVLLLAALALLR